MEFNEEQKQFINDAIDEYIITYVDSYRRAVNHRITEVQKETLKLLRDKQNIAEQIKELINK